MFGKLSVKSDGPIMEGKKLILQRENERSRSDVTAKISK